VLKDVKHGGNEDASLLRYDAVSAGIVIWRFCGTRCLHT
jgi:hypothetical protein